LPSLLDSSSTGVSEQLCELPAWNDLSQPLQLPVGTSGAGNARADADNFFIRNNVAGMTDIPLRDQNGKQCCSADSRWRF